MTDQQEWGSYPQDTYKHIFPFPFSAALLAYERRIEKEEKEGGKRKRRK